MEQDLASGLNDCQDLASLIQSEPYKRCNQRSMVGIDCNYRWFTSTYHNTAAISASLVGHTRVLSVSINMYQGICQSFQYVSLVPDFFYPGGVKYGAAYGGNNRPDRD